ncbi:MAG: class I SAM-dependent methyltransferase [Chloroflexi bacterium]|nr:class I SAM-dependent methyltransferase [Chloroflexota bacterium]
MMAEWDSASAVRGGDGWDALAPVWMERVGDSGDPVRAFLLDPVTLELLGEVRGRQVLDGGCGEGRFARLLARRGAHATAVDLSEQMLAPALEEERRHPLGIRYLRGDLADLSALATASFDAAVANMSLQDVEDYQGALREVARVLRPGGQFVFSILHPCGSSLGVAPDLGWEYTDPAAPSSPRRYYKVDRYFERRRSAIPLWRDVAICVPHHHRPLSDYTTALRRAGFLVRDLAEPAPDPDLVAQDPSSWEKFGRIPYFLVMDAVRLG